MSANVTLRFGDRKFTGPVVGGVPLAEHPLWTAVANQATDDASRVGPDNNADTELIAEWLDDRMTDLVSEYTDLDPGNESVRERIETLAELVAIRF